MKSASLCSSVQVLPKTILKGCTNFLFPISPVNYDIQPYSLVVIVAILILHTS